jgi:D-alanyl-D-alanine carboxypeptidase
VRHLSLLMSMVVAGIGVVATAATAATTPDAALDRALDGFVARADGPPGIAVVVQRGATPALHAAGTAVVGRAQPATLDDRTRVASVAKAYSGATALALVHSGALSLDDTIGARLPQLPSAWRDISLAQLLQHTSGLADFSRSKSFKDAFVASLLVPPPPVDLVLYVADDPLLFTPGARYHYSNTDNVIVGLMIEAATGRPYPDVLQTEVAAPLGLTRTSLPAGNDLVEPFIHGYDIADPKAPEDVSTLFAAGWTWASGGVVATPAEANTFVRGYVGGTLFGAATQRAQLDFRAGSSEPPGPGTNAAGLAVFRYRTRCGTFYGHTGNTPGYTEFVASSRDGRRSASVSVNAQITPTVNQSAFPALRRIFELAACAAAA